MERERERGRRRGREREEGGQGEKDEGVERLTSFDRSACPACPACKQSGPRRSAGSEVQLERADEDRRTGDVYSISIAHNVAHSLPAPGCVHRPTNHPLHYITT